MGLQVCDDATKVLLPSPCPLTPHRCHVHSIMFPKETTLKPPLKSSPLVFQANLGEFIVRGTHMRWHGALRVRDALGARPQCKYNTGAAHTQRAAHSAEHAAH